MNKNLFKAVLAASIISTSAGCTSADVTSVSLADLSKSMTRETNYERKHVSVSYETFGAINDDAFYDVNILQFNKVAEPIEVPTLSNGRKFIGWFADKNCTVPFDFESMIIGDTTIYAKYDSGSYDLTKTLNFVYQSQVRATTKDKSNVYAWMGCEAAALMTALKSTGHILDMKYGELLEDVPRTDTANPYLGFAGSLYGNSPLVDGMMPNVVTAWGAKYGNTKDLTKQGITPVLEALSNGHPVIVWTSSKMMPSQTIWNDDKNWYYNQCGYSKYCVAKSYKSAVNAVTGKTDYFKYYDNPASTDGKVDPMTGEALNYFGSTNTKWEYKTHNHVMVLVGYNAETHEYELADPAENISSGKVKYHGNNSVYWVSEKDFMASWDCYQGAVEVW